MWPREDADVGQTPQAIGGCPRPCPPSLIPTNFLTSQIYHQRLKCLAVGTFWRACMGAKAAVVILTGRGGSFPSILKAGSGSTLHAWDPCGWQRAPLRGRVRWSKQSQEGVLTALLDTPAAIQEGTELGKPALERVCRQGKTCLPCKASSMQSASAHSTWAGGWGGGRAATP